MSEPTLKTRPKIIRKIIEKDGHYVPQGEAWVNPEKAAEWFEDFEKQERKRLDKAQEDFKKAKEDKHARLTSAFLDGYIHAKKEILGE